MLSAMPERILRKPGYMLMALVMAMSWLAMLAEAPAYVLRGPTCCG